LAQITDLYQVQASLAAVQAEQLKLQSELALHRERLLAVSGVNPGNLFRLRDDVEIPTVENSINYWVTKARENNHLIRAKEYALDAAEEQISVRQGAYMPQLSFIVQRQDSNVGFDNRPQSKTDNTYVGLDLSVPLYSGGTNRAAVSEARSLHNIAESELRQAELEANSRVRSAYLQVQSSLTQVEAARILLESATLSSTAMQRGFELGAVTSVEVLNALREQFRAERDLQKARYDHVKFWLYLKREAGALTAEDMLEVSSWLTAP